MAIYGYRVTDGSGRVTEGVIEAAGEAAAKERLRERDLTPIRIWTASAAPERKGGDPPTGTRARGARGDLLPFLQGFRTLLGAGVPMDRALEMAADLFRGGPMGPVAASLLREVRAGSSLSDAMRKSPGFPFNRFLVQMVQAGQATGRLEEALDQAYRFLERSRDFRSDLLGSLLYPVILLAASIVSVVLLVVFVVPRFAGVFASSGVLLPLPTRILLAASAFLRSNFLYLLAAGGALFSFSRAALSRPEVRRDWDRGKMTWPLVGETVAESGSA